MHQCKKFKFWYRWPVLAGQADRCARGRAQTYLISMSLYKIHKIAEGRFLNEISTCHDKLLGSALCDFEFQRSHWNHSLIADFQFHFTTRHQFIKVSIAVPAVRKGMKVCQSDIFSLRLSYGDGNSSFFSKHKKGFFGYLLKLKSWDVSMWCEIILIDQI